MKLTPHELDILKYHNHGYWFDDYGVFQGPQCRFVPIPENATQALIVPRISIKHSNAAPSSTPWWNLIKYWNRSDIHQEAHFQVAFDGTIAQAVTVLRRADCNYKANRFLIGSTYYGAISFETEDNGAESLDRTGWSLEQLHVMIAADTALVIQYGIHCVAPAYWNSSGIGHHSLHSEWSSYVGKTCPGAQRIAQMDYIRQDVTNRAAFILGEMGRSCEPQ